MSAFKHGDIVLVKLNKTQRSEGDISDGHAVVISADTINENLQTVIVCPLIPAQSVLESRIGATLIPMEEISMDSNCLVISLQIKTISKDCIIKRVSSLPANYLTQIKDSLQAVLSMD